MLGPLLSLLALAQCRRAKNEFGTRYLASGIYCGPAGHAGADPGLEAPLVAFLRRRGVATVADLGAGRGQTTLALRRRGFNATAFDGWDRRPRWVRYIDLSKPQHRLGVFDATVSLEVAEHVPSKFEGNYLDIDLWDPGNFLI